MTARSKNRWIVNLKLAARELEIASAKLSRRVDLEKCNCRENLKKEKIAEASINAERAVRERELMENYKQSSRNLKLLILLLQGRSCKDQQIQVQIEGIVRLIDTAMKGRHLQRIKSILDRYAKSLLDSTDGAQDTISEEEKHANDVKTLFEGIAKEENIYYKEISVKQVKSCLSQRSSRNASKPTGSCYGDNNA